jgi:tetratricopeptide (TPR) repeat protein
VTREDDEVSTMNRGLVTTALTCLLLAAAPPAHADRDAWMIPPAASEGSAEDRVDAGFRAVDRKDWPAAEAAFREAIRLRATVPEAWNGLGYALRQQKRYDESVQCYLEALRLRPDYPQALEYLGEAYVEMGQVDDARKVLERLRPLDPDEADELEATIARIGRQ